MEKLSCFLLMVLNSTVSALFQPILFRYAYQREVKLPILISYNLVLGFISNLLLAVISGEWKKWSKIKENAAFCALMCGVLGGPMAQNLYVLSFAFASANLASTISTLLPFFIFILKVFCSTEKLSRSRPSMAKVVGIILMPLACVVYHLGTKNEASLAASAKLAQAPSPMSLSSRSTEWVVVVIGGLLCIGSSTSVNSWFTNHFLEMLCPDIAFSFTMGALMNLFGALAAMIYVVFRYKDEKYYSLGDDTTLRVLVFLSVLASVVATAGARWCAQKKGILYVAAFSNLSLIIDTVAAPYILNGKLQLGSVLSVVIIIIGARLFHWGTIKEAEASAAKKAAAAAAEKDESEIQTAGGITAAALNDATINGTAYNHHTNTAEVRDESEEKEGENGGVEGTDDDDDPHQGQRIDDTSVGVVLAANSQAVEASTDHHETESHTDHKIDIRNDVLENQAAQVLEFSAPLLDQTG